METRKDRSSVFDIFIISILFGLLASRIVYIFSNWQEFSSYIWYWLPYERYGDTIYWFRLMPWNLLNIFDGGIDIFILFVGYLFSVSFLSLLVKKWRWNHMFPTIYFSGVVMLAFSFVLIGLATQNTTWLWEGAAIIVFPIITLILIGYVNRIQKPKKEKNIYLFANILLILISSVTIGYIYTTGDINQFEKISLIFFLAGTFLGLIFFIKDSKRANVVIERVSSVRGIDINQPIKLPK